MAQRGHELELTAGQSLPRTYTSCFLPQFQAQCGALNSVESKHPHWARPAWGPWEMPGWIPASLHPWDSPIPLAKETMYKLQCPLQGSQKGQVTPQSGSKERLKLWLCEMFTTETFVSQTTLGLLKWISSKAEKCPSICLMATSLEAKRTEAWAAGVGSGWERRTNQATVGWVLWMSL